METGLDDICIVTYMTIYPSRLQPFASTYRYMYAAAAYTMK